MSFTKFWLILLILCISIISINCIFYKKPYTPIAATVLDIPKPLPDMKFMVTNGKNLNQYLKDKWSILFFGFTSCHSICPTTLNTLSKIKNLPQVIMITVDPKHDSLKQLESYLKGFNKKFEGARSDEKTTKSIAQKLGIAIENINYKKDSTIEHSGTLLLINPNKEIIAFFTQPHLAINIISDVSNITHLTKLKRR